jgi:ketosteroid isomerase-like protein
MYIKTGSEFIDRPPGWGMEQIEYFENHHYHQPSDEYRDEWDLSGMVEDAQLGFTAGAIVANADRMPEWYSGDEFEAVRKQAIEDLTTVSAEPQLETWRREVRDAEAAFAAMVRERGVGEAFLHFAAADAVLNRNDRLIKGKPAIREYFAGQTLRDVKLEWTPEFVDVSASGDLAYTYGPYTFSAKDAEGKPVAAEGIFHTVWKRQPDGVWKFVWD